MTIINGRRFTVIGLSKPESPTIPLHCKYHNCRLMRIQDRWLCQFCGELGYCKTKTVDVERDPKVNYIT